MPFSLYIHIPFCLRKCRYCDFYSLETSDRAPDFNAYVSYLLRQADGYSGGNIPTVFFGGGTPSLLPIVEFERLLRGLRECFFFMPNAEITVEVNPKTVNSTYLRSLRRLGVNRLSIGIQSFCDDSLRAIGRMHSAAEAAATFECARAAGFDNISIDLMFGLPNQSERSLRAALERAVVLSPEHISLYGLKFEQGTPFWLERERFIAERALPDEDTEARMYLDSVDFLAQNSYKQYEISNFAKEGRECVHNLRYWKDSPLGDDGDYLGLGPTAASLMNRRRFTLRRDLGAYLECQTPADFAALETEAEFLGDAERAREFIMLRLRLNKGLPLDELKTRFGIDLCNLHLAKIERYIGAGLAELSGGALFLTPRGMLVSNAIIGELCE